MDNQQVSDTNYKPIPFASKYMIDEFGNVLSLKRDKHLSRQEVTGYLRVPLITDEGKKSYFLVHRLVAITYIYPTL